MILVVSASEQARLIHGLSVALSVGAMGGKVSILLVLPGIKTYVSGQFEEAVPGADKLPDLPTVKELLKELGVEVIACSAAAAAIGLGREEAAAMGISIKDMPAVLGAGERQVVFI